MILCKHINTLSFWLKTNLTACRSFVTCTTFSILFFIKTVLLRIYRVLIAKQFNSQIWGVVVLSKIHFLVCNYMYNAYSSLFLFFHLYFKIIHITALLWKYELSVSCTNVVQYMEYRFSFIITSRLSLNLKLWQWHSNLNKISCFLKHTDNIFLR